MIKPIDWADSFRPCLEGYQSVRESITLPSGERILHTVSINMRGVPEFDLVRLPDGSLSVQFRTQSPAGPVSRLH